MILQLPDEGWYEIGTDDWQEPRYYDIQGQHLPSVTTVKSIIHNKFIAKWRGDKGTEEANRITRVTADFGSMFHDFTAIMDMVGGGMEVIGTPPPEMIVVLGNYLKWRDANVEEIVAVEMKVYSLKHGYAGRMDRVWVMKGDSLPSLWDLKTGTVRGIDQAQTAAYAAAYTEMTGKEIGRRGLVAASRRTGKVSPKDHTNPNDFAGFIKLLEAYKWLESVGEV